MYLASDVRHAVTRLHEAFTILQRMHALGLAPLDEVSVSAPTVVFVCFVFISRVLLSPRLSARLPSHH